MVYSNQQALHLNSSWDITCARPDSFISSAYYYYYYYYYPIYPNDLEGVGQKILSLYKVPPHTKHKLTN